MAQEQLASNSLEFLAFTDNWKDHISELLENSPYAVAAATAGYFGYVVLGGVSHSLHHQVYTGDPNDAWYVRLQQGRPVTFNEEVYDEFFSFKHYFKTYKLHVLMAGAWLISGYYNLRNVPEFKGADPATKKAMFEGWYHQRLSGYTYVISSFLKGVTATVMSYRSHSLGFARWPMIACGIYDVVALVIAMQRVLEGNIPEHKKWMIRGFCVGAGSIWVRVFGGVWALFDLDFMKTPDLYRKMNDVVLCAGFLQGILFGEYWVAGDKVQRRKWMLTMFANAFATFLGAQNVYRQLREEKEQAKKSA